MFATDSFHTVFDDIKHWTWKKKKKKAAIYIWFSQLQSNQKFFEIKVWIFYNKELIEIFIEEALTVFFEVEEYEEREGKVYRKNIKVKVWERKKIVMNRMERVS